MVLSTTVSQRCWAEVHLYASAHGKTVSEVVEELLQLGVGQPPFAGYFASWYAANTPEDTYTAVLKGREKTVPKANPLPRQS